MRTADDDLEASRMILDDLKRRLRVDGKYRVWFMTDYAWTSDPVNIEYGLIAYIFESKISYKSKDKT